MFNEIYRTTMSTKTGWSMDKNYVLLSHETATHLNLIKLTSFNMSLHHLPQNMVAPPAVRGVKEKKYSQMHKVHGMEKATLQRIYSVKYFTIIYSVH